jgi:hypothetical protein
MSLFAKLLLWTLLTTLVVAGAKADDPWSASPYKSWYDAAEPTDAAKARFGIDRCRNDAEVVRTEFRHQIDKDEWWYLDRTSSTWRRIPDFIIREGKQPPENRPMLFMWNGRLTCFFAPDDEI